MWITKTNPQNKTPKTLKPEPVAMSFVVHNFQQGPLSTACRSTAGLLLRVQIDLQMIYFANNTPVIIPGNCTTMAGPETLFCCYTFVLSIQNVFLFSCLTLILFISCHLLNKRVYSPSAVSVFNISRRCFNWGVLELSVITSCQAWNLNL